MNNVDLLELYKIEKAQMNWPSAPFQSFQEWKAEYMIEFNESRIGSKTVSMEEAVKDADKIVEEAEHEINELFNPATPIKKFRKIRQPKVIAPTAAAASKSSKKSLAVAIYKEMMVDGKHPSRKDVIARFVAECGLTSAGASTYHSNIKKDLGG